MKDRRQYPRIALVARCWIADTKDTVYLRLHDISRGGLSVRAPTAFEPAAKVTIEVEFPSGQVLRARGEVIWSRPDIEGGPRLGARFVTFDHGDAELFELLPH